MMNHVLIRDRFDFDKYHLYWRGTDARGRGSCGYITTIDDMELTDLLNVSYDVLWSLAEKGEEIPVELSMRVEIPKVVASEPSQ